MFGDWVLIDDADIDFFVERCMPETFCPKCDRATPTRVVDTMTEQLWSCMKCDYAYPNVREKRKENTITEIRWKLNDIRVRLDELIRDISHHA